MTRVSLATLSPAMHVLMVAVVLLLARESARALQVDDVDPLVEWRLGGLQIRGNHALPDKELRSVLVTKPRNWYAIWRSRPGFDPITFGGDLERLSTLYRRRGYYHARIEHDLTVSEDERRVMALVSIDEGEPIRIRALDVVGNDGPRALAVDALPLRAGDVFAEERYGEAVDVLRDHYRRLGHARVVVDRQASVSVAEKSATVRYSVRPGPACVFGQVRVEGLVKVDEMVVRREIAFAVGQAFDPVLLTETRGNLRALRLFQTVRLEEAPGDEPTVDVTIRVTEAPPRSIQLGLGFDTDEGVRGLAGWRHYDYFGGARQLGFTMRGSLIRQTVAADTLQPHFPFSSSRLRLLFIQERQEEDTYTLDQTRFMPRLEWDLSKRLAVFAFYRAELDLLSDVDSDVEAALPGDGTPNTAVLSAMGFGADWSDVDDLVDPSRGWLANLTIEPVGVIFGGDADFLRLIAELRRFQPLVAGVGAAVRLRLGAADPQGSESEIPLYERFYAGGTNSVRGYARRRIGALANDEPIGGRSSVVSSVELRRSITETIDLAAFLDAGQVSRDSWNFPFGDLQLGTGGGIRVRTPVGPLRIDIGVPLDRRGSDDSWQFHLSMGQTF